MITVLIGDDNYAIKKKIASLLKELDPRWKSLNYHRFPGSNLAEAIDCAMTLGFGTKQNKVIVVEEVAFSKLGEETIKVFELLPKIPSSTHLILVAPSIDRRLKIAKALNQHSTLIECNLAPPWRTDLIAESIATQAKAIKLALNEESVYYLAEAIGNDSCRAESELKKLAIYSTFNQLTTRVIKELVPSQTQNSLQLAEAMRKNDPQKAMTWLNELFARAESPLVICRTLQTQFRTWLWVKAAITSGIKQDVEIAKFCNLGNPKRVYFLKQEVAKTTIKSLTLTQQTLLDLEVALKQGESPTQVMLPYILNITKLF